MLLSRRTLLAATPLTAFPFAARAQELARGVFTHGVASGDPEAESVVLWTRFAPAAGATIGWEVAEDESFATIAARGIAEATIASDFCLKVIAGGLAPGRSYFYRFLSASGPSPIGRTRTAPREGVQRLTIALFSCSNYAFGYFHAYGDAARREDIDLAVHSGDYIYEYGRDAYPNASEAAPGRVIEPATEIVSLEDYYQRYATYHTDPDLLELRRLKPMTTVWDDHELTNNTWREGAQNHQPATEGIFFDRIAAAAKAYFDWMPIRRPAPQSFRLYRHLDWGDLARIVLLDTRFIGRDAQLEYDTANVRRMLAGGARGRAAVAAFRTILNNSSRTLLGADQEAWFAQALAASKQAGHTWQIVAQQLVMGPQVAPAGLTRLLPENASANTRRYFGGGERLGALGLGWNLDAWDGYPAARQRFLEACAANANNAIVLGGDSHNCWLNNLAAPGAARLAAIEFAGGSVSSPGFERNLTNAAPGEREALLRSSNEAMAWCDMSHRGYGALTFTREACHAEWRAFTDVRNPEAAAPTVARITSAASTNAGPGAWALA
jgi:alkaline phosphatase D